jgi:hypothetical protein
MTTGAQLQPPLLDRSPARDLRLCSAFCSPRCWTVVLHVICDWLRFLQHRVAWSFPKDISEGLGCGAKKYTHTIDIARLTMTDLQTWS